MEIEIEYELNDQDIADSIMTLPEVRTMRAIGALGFTLVLALLASRLIHGMALSAMAIVGPVVTLIFVITPYVTIRQARARIRADQRQVRARLDDEGIHAQTPTISTSHQWAAVERVVEGKRGFLFYTPVPSFLPKRALSPEQLEMMTALVRARVTPRRSASPFRRALLLWLVLIACFLFYYLTSVG